MNDFRNLKAWQKAHRLALVTYEMTRSFPDHERYGLTSQMRRAATSVATNIAEGCGRGTDVDFARFLQMAVGSASELEYLYLLSRDLEMVDVGLYPSIQEQIVEVKRMLTGLIQKLRPDHR
jgi:four helix bundle protein